MRNFVAEGLAIDFTAGANILSGQGVLLGALFGVATGDIANGALGTIKVTGVFDLPKAPSQAWTVGQRIYWDAANARTTNVLTGNTFIGVAVRAVGGGASPAELIGRVRLNGSAPV